MLVTPASSEEFRGVYYEYDGPNVEGDGTSPRLTLLFQQVALPPVSLTLLNLAREFAQLLLSQHCIEPTLFLLRLILVRLLLGFWPTCSVADRTDLDPNPRPLLESVGCV